MDIETVFKIRESLPDGISLQQARTDQLRFDTGETLEQTEVEAIIDALDAQWGRKYSLTLDFENGRVTATARRE